MSSIRQHNILIVASDFPYPPNHGARVDVWGRIKALHTMGHTVDFVGMVTKAPSEQEQRTVEEYVRNIYLVGIEQVVLKKQLLSLVPAAFNMMKNLRSVEHIRFTEHYDFLILEGDASCVVLDNPSLDARYKMLRVHNNEAEYSIAMARCTSSLEMKAFYLSEYFKFIKVSKNLFRKVDRLLFISYDEYRAALKLCEKDKCIFFPAALEEDVSIITTAPSKEVLFVGNLFTYNNIGGLRWYMENVHSLVSKYKGYKLIVAGNTLGADMSWLESYVKYYDNIEFVDTPHNLKPLYNRSRVFINPVRHGAGVKIKNLNAIQNGLAVVSTIVGNDGTGLQDEKDILLTNSAVEFAEKIILLLKDNELRIRLTRSAQNYLQLHYNQKKNLSQIIRSEFNPSQQIYAELIPGTNHGR